MCSSGRFMFVKFTFIPMVHFELIFVKSVRSVLRVLVCLFCLHTEIQFFQSFIYWKDYSISFELPLLFSKRSVDYICVNLFIDYCFVALRIYSIANTTVSWILVIETCEISLVLSRCKRRKRAYFIKV